METLVWDILDHSEYNRGQAEESPITLPGWTSQEVFHTLPETGEDFATAMTQLDKCFSPKNNVDYEFFLTGCSEIWWNSRPVCYSIEKTRSSLWISQPRERVEVSHHPELSLKTSVKVCPSRTSPHVGPIVDKSQSKTLVHSTSHFTTVLSYSCCVLKVPK